MIQPECLESGLKCMIEMKSQDDDHNDVHDGITSTGKQVYSHMIKIMIVGNRNRSLRCFSKAKLNELEIRHVDNEEH